MKRILFLLAVLCLVVNAQEKSYPEVTIGGSEVREYTSPNLDHDYKLLINFPQGYSIDTDKNYPVIYLLDAQWDFPLVSAIYGELYYDGAMPACLLVGVTWGGENPNHDSLRAGSFTPTHNDMIANSGRAEQFQKLLEEEIIPFIDSNYRTEKDERVLMGSSFGGLFTLYTLFTATDLFNKYVLTSPALGWDNSSIYKFESNYAENNKLLPVRVYMTMGGYEDVASYQMFADSLKSRNYEGLALESTVLPVTGHSGGKAEGYSRGLRFVFKKPSLELNAEVLQKYTGTYQMLSGNNIEIIVNDNHLAAGSPGEGKIVLSAESETDFYEPGYFTFVHFETGDSGDVTGFTLKQYGISVFARKVD